MLSPSPSPSSPWAPPSASRDYRRKEGRRRLIVSSPAILVDCAASQEGKFGEKEAWGVPGRRRPFLVVLPQLQATRRRFTVCRGGRPGAYLGRSLSSSSTPATTSHVKHCNLCYCFVCDAPAPCKYWGKGLLNDDHCHATDKEAKWKTLRQAFKCKNRSASCPKKHPNVMYPTTPSPRQQEYYEGYTPEEYRVEDEGEYFEPDEDATVCVRNLPYDIGSKDLAQLFVYAGVVVFSEIIYDRVTGQSCGYGFVSMSTVQEAEKAVELYLGRV